MPSIEQNIAVWDREYDWSEQGEEWSAPFGNTECLWWFELYPRLQRLLPAETICEIGPGFGRWTEYLRRLCRRLILVDLSAKCIERCRTRFSGCRNIEYHVNDGKSLAFLPDKGVDFVFSFDSLVHAEQDVIDAYLRQIAGKLAPNAAGFIHHSNCGVYRHHWRVCERLPSGIGARRLYQRLVSLNFRNGRALSVTAASFLLSCEKAGMHCICQELISWGEGKALVDTLSTFTPSGSRWDRPNRIFHNHGFTGRGQTVKNLAALYADTRGTA